MNCPHCLSEISPTANFCGHCGFHVRAICQSCGAVHPPENRFCETCGAALPPFDRAEPPPPEKSGHPAPDETDLSPAIGERRHLTVLFTDLNGYTHMMEKHDPEDVYGLMHTLLHHCTAIVNTYGGHVERLVGDGLLILFGIPVAHEDDAVRAVKTARAIHQTVRERISPLSDSAPPLTMHTGINTGLVVVGHGTPAVGTYDLSGETLTIASRLSDMAGPDEILVGQETWRQAFGFFDFRSKGALVVKGKTRPISIYAVKREKQRPSSEKRKVKFSADLIGRRDELDRLCATLDNLENGEGAIVCIMGEAGMGKSRLLYEFEKSQAGKRINWITGYAFSHTQQIPYFPLSGLVQRWLAMNTSATADEIRAAVTQRMGDLLGADAEEIPILLGLIGQEVRETAGMTPVEWRKRLASAMRNLLSAVAADAPTVFCMEDLHWGDAASLGLLKDIILNFEHPAVVISTMRPPFRQFTPEEEAFIAESMYKEIHLGELSPQETRHMLASMVDVAPDTLPEELCAFIHTRAEGNPFYTEELLNALIDTRTLFFENGIWKLKPVFQDTDIPSTIHGVVAARIDQLGAREKRILQEAAVIGRTFLYEILKKVSMYGDTVDEGLYQLERAGLIIATRQLPDVEFMFKSTLIQEVSYSSMLRGERQRVHEQVGRAIEAVYADRISEFEETLAIHFQKSAATDKATDYLIRSGTKAFRRHALDESDQYFKSAQAIMKQKS